MGSTKRNALYGLFGSFLLLALCFQQASAQTFAEWFSQKKTQIKYLTQQIAALEQYESYIKQGYEISQNGLGNIGGYIKGEYGSHTAYYNSLKTVNSQVKSNNKADSIISYAKQIPGLFDHLNELSGLGKDNKVYIAKVETKVLDECDKDLSELELVLTSGQAQMSDDERIRRLDDIYHRMKDKYGFTQSFCSQVRMLLLQRTRELQDIQTLGKYYENN